MQTSSRVGEFGLSAMRVQLVNQERLSTEAENSHFARRFFKSKSDAQNLREKFVAE